MLYSASPTHANAVGVADSFSRESRLTPEDTSLAYLPMAWVGDTIYSLVLSLAAGFCCNCPESPETVQRDLRELGPTTLLAPPLLRVLFRREGGADASTS